MMLKTTLTNPLIAIAGRVVEEKTENIIVGAMVKIIEMPELFKTKVSLKELQYGERWGKMVERIDRKTTARDGYFYFINLPPGDYVLETFLPTNATRYGKVKSKVKVSNPINGKVPTTMIDDIVLSPLKNESSIINKQ
ncbi:hypothetical protein NIES267_42810 [Calothrix parasitica NIES-267]|uniref:Carboxypeptidase regulatory-like domain-containing protein n=1 Tax=Calothrix parasitica NIES-267 TaxID=1973488 RepID=A0A1Z4LUC2_9CYAN|nr:hypothetical protein NIES267_42810 [Calothrix parasitica NIES-267]